MNGFVKERFVMERFMMERFVMERFVMERFVAGRFVIGHIVKMNWPTCITTTIKGLFCVWPFLDLQDFAQFLQQSQG